MANSPLVTYTRLSPNHSGKRTHEIDTITIHCVVGHGSLEALGALFAAESRKASSNYGVDDNGKVGMYVEEANRSWCSSSVENDQRAVTIEVASDTFSPYKVTDGAMKGVINLCADICKRNKIKKLLWRGDRLLVGQVDKQNMTVHKWFAATGCPGEYLYGKLGYIADEVNKILGSAEKPQAIKVGDIVSIAKGATYYDGKTTVPALILANKWIVKSVKDDRAIIDKSEDGKYSINSPINVKYLTVADEPSNEFKPYIARVTTGVLNVRKDPTVKSKVVGSVQKDSAYTIIAEQQGEGSTKGWGKLKSGVGWISLDYVQVIAKYA